METTQLLEIVARGEDGGHQFKGNITNVTSLAAELVAFSNSGGGILLIGVADDGGFTGLNRDAMARLNQLVSNAASQSVRPPINPHTENVATAEGLVLVVSVTDGVSKPYMDNKGAIWVKSGADKRKVTSREEMQRLFQRAGLVHGDELPVPGMTVSDLDVGYFKGFFERTFGESVEQQDVDLPTLLQNMNLMRDGVLNVSGALLFATNPGFRLPVFIVKAMAYPGTGFDQQDFDDSVDISGKIADIFQQSLSFVLRNISQTQQEQGINALGRPEIPRIVFEELIVNALIHRDFFISATVRILMFADRIEIISPGHLPNNLTIDNIKSGNSNIRNPILASFATKLLPYRGLGSGIIRALKAYPHIDFQDDRDGNKFTVTIQRQSPIIDE